MNHFVYKMSENNENVKFDPFDEQQSEIKIIKRDV